MNKDDLEALVDKLGMDAVVTWLEDIAYEKAYHLRCNWQDGQSAKVWDKIARVLGRTAVKTGIRY